MRNGGDKPNLFDWLGLSPTPDFTTARRFGRFIGFLMVFVGIAMFVATVGLTIKLGYAVFGDDSEDLRNIGLVLAALIGAPFLVWRTIAAAKQVSIADEALFNDKINAAAQDLAARRQVTRVAVQDGKDVILAETEDDLVTRAAAIDRLEALTHERPDIAPRIDRLLATYVRGTFPHQGVEESVPPFDRKTPRMDLQRAIDAIGRIHALAVKVDPSHWRLDLKGCNFDGVSFKGGHFWAADFSDCRFEAAEFRNGNFEGVFFRHSLLNFADFFKADLTGAKFEYATLSRFSNDISISMADSIKGAVFASADLSGVEYFGEPETLSTTFGNGDTRLSDQLADIFPSKQVFRAMGTIARGNNPSWLTEDLREKVASAEISGFQNWSPYRAGDLANGGLLSELYDKLNLKRWPYWE